MKKLLVIFISLFIVAFANAQTLNTEIVFGQDTLFVEDLVETIGSELTDSIINNILVDASTGSGQRIMYAYNKKFGSSYLVDILSGDFAGKDKNVILMTTILYSTNMNLKTLFKYVLLQVKRVDAGDFDASDYLSDEVVGYEVGSGSVFGTLIAVNETLKIVILESGNNLYKCSYYTVEP